MMIGSNVDVFCVLVGEESGRWFDGVSGLACLRHVRC